jgi:hypothetical protein
MTDLIKPNRRAFLGCLVGIVAAPMVVKYANIMPVKSLAPLPPPLHDMGEVSYTIYGRDQYGNQIAEVLKTRIDQAMAAMKRAIDNDLYSDDYHSSSRMRFSHVESIHCEGFGYKIGL